MNRRERVIGFLRRCRQTHVKWADFLTADPAYPTEDVGDIEHHQECIKGYDETLLELGVRPG